MAALKAARAGGIAVDAGRGLDGLRDLERGIDVVDDFRGGSRSVAALDAVGDVERSLDTVRNVDGARGGVRSVDGASDAAGGVRQVERSVDAGSGGARVDGAACLLGAANSFVAGTRVEMADGSSKAIEDVEIGERVFARDPCTGEQGSREVTHLIAGRGDKVLVDITVDGDTITATDAHPFWVVGPDQWRRADQLRSGDRLVTATGDTIVIDNVDIYRSVDRQVYNVTVADLHTYHVELDGHPVLTHNQNAKPADDCGVTPRGTPGTVDTPKGGVYTLTYANDVVVRTGRTKDLGRRRLNHGRSHPELDFNRSTTPMTSVPSVDWSRFCTTRTRPLGQLMVA